MAAATEAEDADGEVFGHRSGDDDEGGADGEAVFFAVQHARERIQHEGRDDGEGLENAHELLGAAAGGMRMVLSASATLLVASRPTAYRRSFASRANEAVTVMERSSSSGMKPAQAGVMVAVLRQTRRCWDDDGS